MALIDCPKCGKTISDRAVKCPHCGADPKSTVQASAQTPAQAPQRPQQSDAPVSKRKSGKTLSLILFILLGLAVIGGAGYYFSVKTQNPTFDEIGKYMNFSHDQLTKLANNGDCEAMRQIGRNAFNSQDYTTAFKWWLKAADKGYAVAQYSVGMCYEYGYGVSKNDEEAVKWFRKAAEQGYAPSQNVMGYYYYKEEKDLNKAFEWFEKAAKQGDAEAQLKVGCFYQMGWSVDKDMKEALNWYMKSADQDYAPAQFVLGMCYLEGNDIPRDYDKGIALIESAAKQGNEEASDILIKQGIWGVAEEAVEEVIEVPADTCIVEDSGEYTTAE